MEEARKINLILIFSILAMVFSLFGTCSSCLNSKKVSMSEHAIKGHVDSVLSQTYTGAELKLMLKIQGLVDERRSVLNINQIFLTQKRPDQRVIEIDGEIGRLEEQLKTLRKNVSNPR
jgi:hypothetical protein